MTSRERDDQFHAKWAEGPPAIGVLSTEARYRLNFLCPNCASIHRVSGNLQQTQNTFTALLLAGYPVLQVIDEAFATLGESEGRDITTDQGLAETAEDFSEFLRTIGG